MISFKLYTVEKRMEKLVLWSRFFLSLYFNQDLISIWNMLHCSLWISGCVINQDKNATKSIWTTIVERFTRFFGDIHVECNERYHFLGPIIMIL